MNTYKKYCPNVFVAQCTEKHERGETITVVTKYGKENEHIVHNFIGYTGTRENPLFCYSITRADGFNTQEWAKRRAEKLERAAVNAEKKGDEYYDKSNRHADFLSLGEPIKVGHHSEKRHRKIIEQAHNNMGKYIEQADKAKEYESRAEYWESRTNDINLSMPESLEYYQHKLERAKTEHEGLKDGSIPRSHSYSLTYARKKVKDLEQTVKLAKKLWGEPEEE